MKKKKITQKQIQSMRERSAKPGRLKRSAPDKKSEINPIIDYNAWNNFKMAVDFTFFSGYTEELSTKAINISDSGDKISEKIGLLIDLFGVYNFDIHFKNLPSFVYNDIEEKYLNRVSTSKGPHVFASMTPMQQFTEKRWKLRGKK